MWNIHSILTGSFIPPPVQIPEHIRIAYIRMRLSYHNLKIETRRWAQIPRDQITSQSGEIQSEEHVLLGCLQTLHLRESIETLQLGSLLTYRMESQTAAPWQMCSS
jgi:hypothetical protein